MAGPRQARAILVFSLSILSATCIDSPAGIGNFGRVRLVNLISEGTLQPVDVYLDGDPFGVRLPFGASTPLWLPPPATGNYARIPWGNHSITLARSSDSSVVAQYTFSLGSVQDRSIYATGSGGFFANESVDDNVEPDPGKIRLRVVNVTTTLGAVDVFVTTLNATLATATPVATDVVGGNVSAYFDVAPGTWHVRAVSAGVAPAARAANVVLSMPDQTWERGGRSIVVAEQAFPGGVFVIRGVILADQ